MSPKDALNLAKLRREIMRDILAVGTAWQNNSLKQAALENYRLKEIDRLIDRVKRDLPQDVVPSGEYKSKDPKVADKMLEDLERAEAASGK